MKGPAGEGAEVRREVGEAVLSYGHERTVVEMRQLHRQLHKEHIWEPGRKEDPVAWGRNPDRTVGLWVTDLGICLRIFPRQLRKLGTPWFSPSAYRKMGRGGTQISVVQKGVRMESERSQEDSTGTAGNLNASLSVWTEPQDRR